MADKRTEEEKMEQEGKYNIAKQKLDIYNKLIHPKEAWKQHIDDGREMLRKYDRELGDEENPVKFYRLQGKLKGVAEYMNKTNVEIDTAKRYIEHYESRAKSE